jgi:hypothetical protein
MLFGQATVEDSLSHRRLQTVESKPKVQEPSPQGTVSRSRVCTTGQLEWRLVWSVLKSAP